MQKPIYIYIYSAHTLAHTKPLGRQFSGKHIYIYDAHTLAHTRALMCTKDYIYIVRIPSRIPILHKHAFPDRLAGTALRGTPFPWAAHTPRIPKSVSSKAWRAHWLLSGPRTDTFADPGKRARRWGKLENKVPEEGGGGFISGPRKSSTPLGIANK